MHPPFAPARFLALVATLSLLACGPRTAPDPMDRSPGGGGGGDADEVVVQVRNDNFADVEVYLIRDGSRRRLGVVVGKDSQRFVLGRTVFPGSGQLRFGLDPLGSRGTVTTQSVLVNPGETVYVEIGIELSMTRVSVRR